MVEEVHIIRWKVSDGSLFQSEKEATVHEQKCREEKMKLQDEREKQLKNYEALHQEVVKLYIQNRCPSDHCNCDNFDYSEKCLVIDNRGHHHHLCTCKSGICKRHTNCHFKNKGCFGVPTQIVAPMGVKHQIDH